MKIQDFTTNVRTMRFSMWLARRMPVGLGHRLAWWASAIVCRSRPAVMDVLEANLRQVLGPDADEQTLARTVRQVLFTTIRCTFDLYRVLHLPYEELVASIDWTDESLGVARSMWDHEGGTVLIFPHVENFDLGGLSGAAHLPEIQIVTLADPPPGFELTNRIRRLTGTTVTPLGPSALRQALKLLKQGGVVSVAGDRPVSERDDPVLFFGRPARVPSGHVRLALRTGAMVVIYHCGYSAESRRYTVHLEPPMEMVRTGDLNEEIELNMRRVLDALEAVIRRRPGGWQMYVPVWPQ